MRVTEKKVQEQGGEIMKITAEDLRRKQSVRATFKLPRQTITLLSVVARQLGVKQKSLFDQLNDNPTTLVQLVQNSREFVQDSENRQQKTFVISRSALAAVNQAAKQENIPRDLLVELSISRLLSVVADELEKHKKRKAVLVEMEKHLQQGRKILAKAESLLGSEDQLCETLEKQIRFAESDIAEMQLLIKQGAAMEEEW